MYQYFDSPLFDDEILWMKYANFIAFQFSHRFVRNTAVGKFEFQDLGIWLN